MKIKTILLACFSVTVSAFSTADVRGEDTVPVKHHQNLEFAEINGQALNLDLYLPERELADADQKSPLVVWIHGGGWRAGSKNNPSLKRLTQHGYAVASISYRFTDKAIFPAQIHDCKAAVRWLRANADRFGYEAKWIAVAGSSAGGHLALLMGVSGGVESLEGDVGNHLDQSSKVQAVIDYFGPSDFVLRCETHPERSFTAESGSFALLGGIQTGKLDPELQTTASPSVYVTKDDPPLLVFHGTEDEVVLIDQSERIVQLYQDAGLQTKFIKLESAGHGGKAFFRGDHFESARKFLDSHRPK